MRPNMTRENFAYRRRPRSFTSFLWSLWLRVPSSIRLALYQALWRIADWHHGSESVYVVRLPFGLYAKEAFDPLEEALATQYVSEHTSIPVPLILDLVPIHDPSIPKLGLIIMTSVPGRSFGSTRVLVHEMTSQQQDIFVETLRGWFDQLRSLPPPRDLAICGFTGGGLYSFRIQDIAEGPVGPFASQDDFHAQSFCIPWEPYDDSLRTAFEKRQATRYRICLTHGDITPTNILVDQNLRPTGLVDWQTASWMPEYWEYTRSIWIRERYTGWRNVFGRIFPGYDSELEVEIAVWKHWFP